MDWQGKSLRVGAAVIGCALLLRLFSGGVWDRLWQALLSREAMSVVLFMETGRVLPEVTEATQPAQATQPTQPGETLPAETQPPEAAVAVFSSEDAALVQVHNACGYEARVEQRLLQSLQWDLTQEAPAVLIVHSHGTESYENTENYQPSSAYRTRDPAYNVVSVGDRLVQVLEAGGVHAVHDRQLHDSPSYSASYSNSRKSVEQYLQQYPSIRLVLDIHRDAVEREDGTQAAVVTQVSGVDTAQLMLVVGTDASGLSHPQWSENMALAVKLHAQLEKLAPGICRPISFRTQRFNQDLSPGALIVEVGAAGNTRQEALLAVELLGQALLELAHGAQGAKK